MYIGIDLGTSGVKAILLNEQGDVVASHTEKLTVSRPHPLWSEQDPEQWWSATDRALKALGQQHSLREVKALGIAGQMHGATLLDEQQKVLRPAILWNDGRCGEECVMLENQVPQSRAITGNLMMPGFTAPKLLWVQRHEPEMFNQIDKVLLPKDYLRLRMTGDFASDMSDAAGTMWLDVAKRDWSDVMLAACKLTRAHMPALYEGSEITGTLLPDVAKAWGMQEVAVVAGGGDNAAGAVGVGMMNAGQAMLSLGTSGVYFAVSDGFLSKPESAVHSFCHALPERWHLMSVMLSAASCLDWAAKLTGLASVPALIDAAQQADEHAEPVWFLPYLSGERTPHNNPQAKGVFFGLTHQHGPAELAQAVLEGVGFALADGMDVVHACGVQPVSITLIGGGARSEYWRQMLSDISGLQLDYRTGGDVGPALGAARLAQIAMNPQRPLSDLLPQLTLEQAHYPDAGRHALYQQRRETFRRIYQQLQPLMS
ncbi:MULTISPECIES: xylulokinase [Citrobacter]|uniref:xylulokinase n=1 Tax=Citrobacter TaxID=544 RepID=UPI0005CD30F1|nr:MULTISPECIES: xylulokinase [Citrobacter]KAE9749985.1 xylulokinase [Enterobacteriaceae bacterium TzEc058]MDT3757489.1 xylulokinase [Citrobacter freundii complex sp. 2023EL-00962]QAR63264.1 xylulokinase [Citrobacter sp. SL156]AKL18690.1 xylulose kinase [Citrobacter freundii]AKL57466.1 xylulose kinase [Citrobacter freundii]